MVASAERDEDARTSLALLQNHIKRDPEAYQQEFTTQLQHFASVFELLSSKPQKPNKRFAGLVMFMAHVVPCFPGQFDLAATLIDCLQQHALVLHRATRRVIVSALVLLRRKAPNQVPVLRTLPVFFKLFSTDDKLLRTQIYTHIAKDLLATARVSKAQSMQGEIQRYIFSHLKGNDFTTARRAAALSIALYYKRIWTDARTVNQIATCVLCPDLKVAGSAIMFFLGQRQKRSDGELSDSEDDEEEEKMAREAARATLGSKKTKGKLAKLARASKVAKKVMRRNQNKNSESHVDFAAIDLLYDPQALAEKLLQRASKSNEPFAFRLRVLQLATRLIGRHELVLLNVYPFLQRYLSTSQRQVTVVLACVAQAIHPQVPEDELQPIMQHIIRTFVAEHAAPEVVVVGLNALTECARRNPLILTEEQLADLSGFMKVKGKGIASAARGIVNMYREADPARLDRALRGKEAQMAISRGEVQRPTFGVAPVEDTVTGIELLAQRKLAKAEKLRASGQEAPGSDEEDEDSDSDGWVSVSEESDDGEGLDWLSDEEEEEEADEEEEDLEEDEEEEEEEEVEEDDDEEEEEEEEEEDFEDDEEASVASAEPSAAQSTEITPEKVKAKAESMAMDQILSNEDFKKMRKLDLTQRMEMRLGRKRKASEAVLGDDSEVEDSDAPADNDEGWDMVDPRLLAFTGKKKATKARKLASVLEGRKGRDKNDRDRRGGSTNIEKTRRKPASMVRHRVINKKSNMTAQDKAKSIKKHVKTLKNKVGPRKLRRR